jgi:UDP-N-acetylglucosamine 4,6-dehydratase
MIPEDEAHRTLDCTDCYLIRPSFDWGGGVDEGWHSGTPVPADFRYASDTNPRWLSAEELLSLAHAMFPEENLLPATPQARAA